MTFRTIDGEAAWRRVRGVRRLRWRSDAAAFEAPAYPVWHEPKFRLRSEDRIFCIGSCFARNVEEHLAYRGMKVLSQRIVAPVDEALARPAGIVNKFTSFSMAHELRWASSPPAIDESLFARDGQGGWHDLQLSSGQAVSFERAVERRRYFVEDYFARLRSADVVILTLGLIEAWRDLATNIHLNVAPPETVVAQNPGRYVLEVTDVAANVEALDEIHRRLLTLNPSLRVIVTVSPVPLAISFTGQDPVVANTLSKSTLRCCAERLASRPNVDYFPSYEMIMHAPRTAAYAPDFRHVRDSVVSVVMDRFLETYGAPASAAPQGFTELGYLAANPDVESEVRAGLWDSGYQHYAARGRAEGRPLLPADGPTARMIKAGAA